MLRKFSEAISDFTIAIEVGNFKHTEKYSLKQDRHHLLWGVIWQA